MKKVYWFSIMIALIAIAIIIVGVVMVIRINNADAALLSPSRPGGLLTPPPLNFVSNKIGIASSTPLAQFSIENNNSLAASTTPLFSIGDQGSSTPYFMIDSLWGRVGIQNDNPSATLHIGANAGDTPFQIGSSTPQFKVTYEGKVGVGTSTPDFELSVDSGSTATTSINIGDVNDIGTKDSPGCINISTNTGAWWRIYIGDNAEGGTLGLIGEAGRCDE